jgi:hypothetical protein
LTKDRHNTYKPNVIPKRDRILNTILAFVLIAYGTFGLVTARLNFLRGWRSRIDVALEGGSAWLMGAALILGGLVLFSVVIDHFDTRNNEKFYRGFKWITVRLAWCLFAAALLSHLYTNFTK